MKLKLGDETSANGGEKEGTKLVVSFKLVLT
jgi:hypothetical protein